MIQEIKDKNVFNVVCEYAYRANKGFEKYGQTTERTDIDLLGWLQHLQEELMDATIYIERTKHEILQKKSTPPPLVYPELHNKRTTDRAESSQELSANVQQVQPY